MTRGDNRDGIAAIGAPTARTAARIADLIGDLAVAARFAVGNHEQRGPHAALEVGAAEFERQIEPPARARKVFCSWRSVSRSTGCCGSSTASSKWHARVTRCSPDQRDQRAVGNEGERADGESRVARKCGVLLAELMEEIVARDDAGEKPDSCCWKKGRKRQSKARSRETLGRGGVLGAGDSPSPLAALGARFASANSVQLAPQSCRTRLVSMHVRFESHGRQRKRLADEVRFELTCRNYPTIRFRVGAVMTTSVPVRARTFLRDQIGGASAGRVF